MEIAGYSHAAAELQIGEWADDVSRPDESKNTGSSVGASPAVQPHAQPASRIVDIGSQPTSSDVTLFPKRAQDSTPLIPQPYSPLFPWTASQPHLTFTQRYRLACVERGVQLLSDPTISIESFHPILSLHLRTMTIEEMRYYAERSLFQKVGTELPKPIPKSIIQHPSIFRTVEGDRSVFVDRKYKREADSLVFGCTRTVVDTWLPGFEGEWLEPIDVIEYLQSKDVMGLDGECGSEGREVVFDKQRFLEYLALRAICIGLGPAVRKSDVEKALEICLF